MSNEDHLSFAVPVARRHLLPALFLAMLLAGCANVAQVQPGIGLLPEPNVAELVKPKVGLVLGGGAARGFAHIGVIQALEEAGIRPDLVVGTSAGSVVAALYASGKSGRELQNIAETMDEASFSDWRLPFFKPGLLKGEALARFVKTQVDGKQIQDLQMPLGVVATDLHSGQGVLFQRGDVATAVRASSAIPAVFQPVPISGREYVDGGLVAPVPVEFARQMGAQVVIAVDISTDPEAGTPLDTFQILMQTFSIMGNRINAFELRGADIVVRPVTSGLSSTSFNSRMQAIAAGYRGMQPMIDKLRSVIRHKSKPLK
jgi:NTE family protein